MDMSSVFRQQVSFSEPVGVRGAHGDPDFTGAALQVANARVEPSVKSVLTSLGDEAVSSHFVMMDREISVFARAWLPGSDTSDPKQARRPLRVDPVPDLDGVTNHWEVYF